MSERSLAARRRMQNLHIQKMKIGKNTLIKATDNQGKTQIEIRGKEYSDFDRDSTRLAPGTQIVALNDNNLRQMARSIKEQMGIDINEDSILESLKMATDEYKKYGDPSIDTENNKRRLMVGQNGEIIELDDKIEYE